MPRTPQIILDDDAIDALVEFIRDLDDMDDIARLYTMYRTDDIIIVQGLFGLRIFRDGKRIKINR